jgi:hypothetical protein
MSGLLLRVQTVGRVFLVLHNANMLFPIVVSPALRSQPPGGRQFASFPAGNTGTQAAGTSQEDVEGAAAGEFRLVGG